MPRSKSATRERILTAADRLFYSQGIRAVAVDSIAAEAGITKRTLYDHFASKDALVTAYLNHRIKPLVEDKAPPVEQILGLFDWFGGWFASDGFHGCPFVNAVAELGATGHPAREIAVAYKERRRAWFRERLREAGAKEPDALASQLGILLDGAIATALVRRDPSAARHARAAAETLIKAAGV